MTAASNAPLRIALSATSAASLGSFEAGAVAALLTAVQRWNCVAAEEGSPSPVRVDTVGATSAGALVGLLASRSLLAGLDPLWVLHQAWVERASLARLMRRRDDAPLSLLPVREDLGKLLDPRDRRGRAVHRVPEQARQAEPIRLSIALGNLQGLTFDLPEVGNDPSVAAMTHVDWDEFVFTGDEVRDYQEPPGSSAVDAVLASMSQPAAFSPWGMDRSGDRAEYERQGVANFPDSGHFWYCDGSALLRHPFARTLDRARASEEDDGRRSERPNRVHVLVHPHTAAPLHEDTWTAPDVRPSWTATVSRILAALTTQSLYDDMREIERINALVRWARELGDVLSRHIPQESAADLRDLLARIRQEGHDLGQVSPQAPVHGVGASDGVAELVAQVVAEASGTAGRTEVRTEVVSPLRLLTPGEGTPRTTAREHEVRSLLAGEFLGRFGGFTDRTLRQSDFALGWDSCRTWLPGAARRGGLGEREIDAALTALDERGVTHGGRDTRGGATVQDLPLSARLRLASLVLRAARMALRDTPRSRG